MQITDSADNDENVRNEKKNERKKNCEDFDHQSIKQYL